MQFSNLARKISRSLMARTRIVYFKLVSSGMILGFSPPLDMIPANDGNVLLNVSYLMCITEATKDGWIELCMPISFYNSLLAVQSRWWYAGVPITECRIFTCRLLTQYVACLCINDLHILLYEKLQSAFNCYQSRCMLVSSVAACRIWHCMPWRPHLMHSLHPTELPPHDLLCPWTWS